MFEIGNSLREARLRQQLELPDLERTTKIRGKYLLALEEEQFDVLPAQTYVKGFLRTYADSLGLDGQLYVDEFNSRYVAGDDESQPRPRLATARRPHRSFERRAVVLTLVVIAALVGLFLAAWKFGSGGSSPKVPGVNERTQSVTPPAQHKKKTASTPAKATPHWANLLLVAATGPTWLEIHRGGPTGPQLFQGTLEQGNKLWFHQQRYFVNIGAPENLLVRVNGRRRFVPGGQPRSVIADWRGIRPAG